MRQRASQSAHDSFGYPSVHHHTRRSQCGGRDIVPIPACCLSLPSFQSHMYFLVVVSWGRCPWRARCPAGPSMTRPAWGRPARSVSRASAVQSRSLVRPGPLASALPPFETRRWLPRRPACRILGGTNRTQRLHRVRLFGTLCHLYGVGRCIARTDSTDAASYRVAGGHRATHT